jgi:hypothetical protein
MVQGAYTPLPNGWQSMTPSAIATLFTGVNGQEDCYSSSSDIVAVLMHDPKKLLLSEGVAREAISDPSSSAWQPTVLGGAGVANALGNANQCSGSCSTVLGVEYQDINFGGAYIVYYGSQPCNGNPGGNGGFGWAGMPPGWNDQVSSSLNWPGSNCNSSFKYIDGNFNGAGNWWSGNWNLRCPGIYPNWTANCQNYVLAGFNDQESSVGFVPT